MVISTVVLDAGTFLEDFIRQSLLPATVPINRETVKLLKDDGRKVVLTILEDESDESSLQLIKVLRSAANANHDLVFGYVGVKQWEEFTETFDVKVSQLPKIVVWDTKEEYEVVSRFSFTVCLTTYGKKLRNLCCNMLHCYVSVHRRISHATLVFFFHLQLTAQRP
jgi:hypothetical protein